MGTLHTIQKNPYHLLFSRRGAETNHVLQGSLTATPTSNQQPSTSNLQLATYNVHLATYNVHLATYNVHLATNNVQLATQSSSKGEE